MSGTYKKHEHDFSVLPSNDDEQQCDNDCRVNHHRCSVCNQSRKQVARDHPDEVREYVSDSVEEVIRELRAGLKFPSLAKSAKVIEECSKKLGWLAQEQLVETTIWEEKYPGRA